MNNFLKLLGHHVRDRVTGFEGIATSVGFDLYGCVQAIVTPIKEKASDKLADSHWFDEKRLEVLSKEPVMAVPTFESGNVPGGQIKPALPSAPLK